MLFLDQLVTRLPGEGGENKVLDPPARRQLKQELAMPLAVADELGRDGAGAIDAHRIHQALRKHVVALRALFGDDRFRDGAGTRRVTARSGLYQRNEEVAPCHDSTPVFRAASRSERVLAHGMRAGAERPPRKAASGA